MCPILRLPQKFGLRNLFVPLSSSRSSSNSSKPKQATKMTGLETSGESKESTAVSGGPRKYAGEDIPENMTKSAFKRLKKMERMEADREEFIEKRRQKRRDQRKRNPTRRKLPNKSNGRESSGVTIVIDCGFDKYMTVPERTSLAGQLTRCYSENRRSLRPVELIISGFNSQLRSRFENEMRNTHKLWTDVRFVENDYLPTIQGDPDGESQNPVSSESAETGEIAKNAENAVVENTVIENAVYLTGDAEDILTDLEPGTTYYVGGIVDKNRYVNLCLNKAKSLGIRTAKLPIDEHIRVSGRRVLTTNQAFELLLRWLELRDWKLAFEAAIPSRKLLNEEKENGEKGSESENNEDRSKDTHEETNNKNEVELQS